MEPIVMFAALASACGTGTNVDGKTASSIDWSNLANVGVYYFTDGNIPRSARLLLNGAPVVVDDESTYAPGLSPGSEVVVHAGITFEQMTNGATDPEEISRIGIQPGEYSIELEVDGQILVSAERRLLEAGHVYTLVAYGDPDAPEHRMFSCPSIEEPCLAVMNVMSDRAPMDLWSVEGDACGARITTLEFGQAWESDEPHGAVTFRPAGGECGPEEQRIVIEDPQISLLPFLRDAATGLVYFRAGGWFLP